MALGHRPYPTLRANTMALESTLSRVGPTDTIGGTMKPTTHPTTLQRAAERGRVDGILVAHGIERSPWPMLTVEAERAYMDNRAEWYRRERDRAARFGPTLPA